MADLKPGDVVKLISGGAPMTVLLIVEAGTKLAQEYMVGVHVGWHDTDGQPCAVSYPPAALIKQSAWVCGVDYSGDFSDALVAVPKP